MTLSIKKMLESKFVCFYFLVVEIFVKMSPFSERERTRNYRKNMSKEKLKEVCENEKLRKGEREVTEKVNDIKRTERKEDKGQGTTAMLQTNVKIEQEARIGRVPYTGKAKS